MPRVGQGGEHDDGLDDVVVDLVALLRVEGAPPYREVVQLAPVVEMLGLLQLEAPGIVGGKNLPRRPGDDVVRPISQQRLPHRRSEEHTSELQSLMRISYAVFCLKKKKKNNTKRTKAISNTK